MASVGNLGLNDQDGMSGELEYYAFVEEYSSGGLTKDDDALNACFSLLQLLSSQLHSDLCWGLP